MEWAKRWVVAGCLYFVARMANLLSVASVIAFTSNECYRKSMKISHPESRSISPLSSDELGHAQQSRSIFARHTDKRGRLAFQIRAGQGKESVVVPAAVARLFEYILDQASEGNTVAILPQRVELTTQQAADLLNVSRPYLIGLLDSGKIPCRKVGTHRRIYAKDVLEYKRAIDARRNRVLNELAKEAQELNMGY